MICKTLWERGITVSVEDCRKWLAFVEWEGSTLADELEGLEDWKITVILNQLYRVTDEETASELVNHFKDAPMSLIILLRKYYPVTGNIELLRNVPYQPEPEYVASTKSVLEFFLNYLRFEEGVDVDSIVEKVKNVVEKENLVEEVLRLSDIDAIISGKEFAERVERVVDILGKVKEQGLDVEKVVMRWDELANSGGERFEYLERAVKEVADEEVADRFWKEVEKVLNEKGIKVSGKGGVEIPLRLFMLDLISTEGTNVDISQFSPLLEKLSSVLKTLRPVPVYTTEEIERILDMVGVKKAIDSSELERPLELLSKLDRFALTLLFEQGVDLYSLINETDMDVERAAEELSKALREAYKEGLKGESLIDYLRRRLSG